jgi:hypothetical protein
MARPRQVQTTKAVADVVLETPESSVLDLLDHLLNKGVTATGDIVLGVAGIDLIYLRLSTILCAADRVLPGRSDANRHTRRRRPPATKRKP